MAWNFDVRDRMHQRSLLTKQQATGNQGQECLTAYTHRSTSRVLNPRLCAMWRVLTKHAVRQYDNAKAHCCRSYLNDRLLANREGLYEPGLSGRRISHRKTGIHRCDHRSAGSVAGKYELDVDGPTEHTSANSGASTGSRCNGRRHRETHAMRGGKNSLRAGLPADRAIVARHAPARRYL
jgi:hypothetical protein